MNQPALQVDGVVAGYAHRPVLHDLSLEVESGQVLALIGPNGAGKTTILRVCSGVLRPTSGRVVLAGVDLGRLPRAEVARRVAVVAQESVSPPAITGREMVELGRTPHLRLLFGPGARDRAAVDWALEVTGASYLASRLVEELSGGERQRILLARALAQQPRVLLLDEPTANLDLRHQVRVLELVRRLAREQGLAVIAAVHDLQLAALFSDRVALLSGGRLRRLGTPEETFTPGALGEVFDQEVVLSVHPTHGVPLVALVPGEHARRARTSDAAC